MDVSGQFHAPAALLPRNGLLYALDKGWLGTRAGLALWRREKSLIPAGNRTPAVPTELSQLLFRVVRLSK
jgi:hypothetical protein